MINIRYYYYFKNKVVFVGVSRLTDTSHGSQALSPKSLVVNPCNPNYREHGSWDSPFHMGPHVN